MSENVAQAVPQSHSKEVLALIGAFFHCWGLLRGVKSRRGCRSYYARIEKTGESILLSDGFNLDGTDFLINDRDGSIRRVPASEILCIEDKGDWGY